MFSNRSGQPATTKSETTALQMMLNRKWLILIIVVAIVILSLGIILIVMLTRDPPPTAPAECNLLSGVPFDTNRTLISAENKVRIIMKAYIIFYEKSENNIGYLRLDNAKLYFEGDESEPKLIIKFDCGQIYMFLKTLGEKVKFTGVGRFGSYITLAWKANKGQQVAVNEPFEWEHEGILFPNSDYYGHYICPLYQEFSSDAGNIRAKLAIDLMEFETYRHTNTPMDMWQHNRDNIHCRTIPPASLM